MADQLHLRVESADNPRGKIYSTQKGKNFAAEDYRRLHPPKDEKSAEWLAEQTQQAVGIIRRNAHDAVAGPAAAPRRRGGRP